ncbi:hypothetical protein O2V63_05730 [Modestobacter sp. VKM Ac-2977]|uniref:hypothetical protein n=1 Tax=Modestobacter sp. VKM Ac-2977 TaxID=3004131 RepID=UPI0022AA67A6|nr:hypothetical protein [Modestobacter sp. VKM Ac-2977]MCZ2819821.1 hypothetical protein [Modestobacter sp. VKM Ac-2977]
MSIATGSQTMGLAAGLTAIWWPATLAPAAAVVLGAVTVSVLCLRGSAEQDRAGRRRPYRAFMAIQYAANASLLVHSLL